MLLLASPRLDLPSLELAGVSGPPLLRWGEQLWLPVVQATEAPPQETRPPSRRQHHQQDYYGNPYPEEQGFLNVYRGKIHKGKISNVLSWNHHSDLICNLLSSGPTREESRRPPQRPRTNAPRRRQQPLPAGAWPEYHSHFRDHRLENHRQEVGGCRCRRTREVEYSGLGRPEIVHKIIPFY